MLSGRHLLASAEAPRAKTVAQALSWSLTRLGESAKLLDSFMHSVLQW